MAQRTSYKQLERQLRTALQERNQYRDALNRLQAQLNGLDIRTRALRLAVDTSTETYNPATITDRARFFEHLLINGLDPSSPDSTEQE